MQQEQQENKAVMEEWEPPVTPEQFRRWKSDPVTRLYLGQWAKVAQLEKSQSVEALWGTDPKKTERSLGYRMGRFHTLVEVTMADFGQFIETFKMIEQAQGETDAE